ncbi:MULTISPECIES: ABATE domain-containing protein [unclassified Nocardia]|uniref:CGNR zinc finger domain-containing protein n=1 Tax=unclassified Nocardia TaxID=2637762 RepID=UPI001CE443B9|nr:MULTISPECIES: ABATE domain-containing protein [unclassified Nocardia]
MPTATEKSSAPSSSTPRFRQGAGRISLDFVRTLRYRGAATVVDELADPAALAAWVRQCGPIRAGRIAPPTAAALTEARAVREAAYALIEAARSGAGADACPGSARRILNNAALGAPPAPQLSNGQLSWIAEDPVAATLVLIARDALELATSEHADRIRICAGADCQALFLDTSRPGSRRWCSMGTCGNRAKKAALRERTEGR